MRICIPKGADPLVEELQQATGLKAGDAIALILNRYMPHFRQTWQSVDFQEVPAPTPVTPSAPAVLEPISL